MDKQNVKYTKYCLVPQCRSTSIRTPDKIFLSLPVATTAKLRWKRKLWLRAMKYNENHISNGTRAFVCEDHFNLEQDMKNYLRHKLMGGNIFLKEHAVPHRFDCQSDIERSLESAAAKRARKDIVDTLLQSSDSPSCAPMEIASIKEEEIEIETTSLKEEAALELQPKLEEMEESKLQQRTFCDKATQTVQKVQRSIATQYRPLYRSKFVQTNIVIVSNAVSVSCSPFKSIMIDSAPSPSKSDMVTISEEVSRRIKKP